MTHLDILLPFGLLPPQLGGDLLRVLKAPSLATLLARTRFGKDAFQVESFDEFARALPHETWSARRFGLEASPENGASSGAQAGTGAPFAASAMRAFGLEPDAGFWFMVQPVHIHIARDHLVLTDQRQLTLSEPESQHLFDIARPLFEQAGKTLLYANADTWFLRADDWSELQTATPDAACGRSIDLWTPKGAAELQWRKLQNEVQMEWFAELQNQTRQLQQHNPANSIWLWGGAPASLKSIEAYRHTFNLPDRMVACSATAGRQKMNCNAEQVIATAQQRSLLVLDQLMMAALANDWSLWLEQMHALEQDWFLPLLQALQSGKIDQITLVCSNSTHLLSATASTRSLKKFWIKPSLARLQA
jgi:hypothetical protein